MNYHFNKYVIQFNFSYSLKTPLSEYDIGRIKNPYER